jgi:outer membrane murein-binding lipoprotein Lpp
MNIKDFKNILILMMVVCVAFSLLTGCSNTANADVIDDEAAVNEAASDEAADIAQHMPAKRYGPF